MSEDRDQRILSEGELIDAYRGTARPDAVPDFLMPGHMHVYHRHGRQPVTVWHRHSGYTVRHPLDVDGAHKKGDPRRETMMTYDKKTLEDLDG